jgi:hypothetical protein
MPLCALSCSWWDCRILLQQNNVEGCYLLLRPDEKDLTEMPRNFLNSLATPPKKEWDKEKDLRRCHGDIP